MEETIIKTIEDVQVGDIVYYGKHWYGAVVVSVNLDVENSRLKVETPEDFEPFNVAGETSVWLLDEYFKYAARPA